MMKKMFLALIVFTMITGCSLADRCADRYESVTSTSGHGSSGDVEISCRVTKWGYIPGGFGDFYGEAIVIKCGEDDSREMILPVELIDMLRYTPKKVLGALRDMEFYSLREGGIASALKNVIMWSYENITKCSRCGKLFLRTCDLKSAEVLRPVIDPRGEATQYFCDDCAKKIIESLGKSGCEKR